jgi:hypothetical protein
MHFPAPVRAVVGLVASAADEAKHLPERAIELPMLAVSTALQMSMRAQQRYARLAARGDEVLNRRPPGDEPPPWATFDEPVPAGTDPEQAAGDLLDRVLRVAEEPPEEPPDDTPASATGPASATDPAAAAAARASGAPAKKTTAARKAPAKKAPGKKLPAKTVPSAEAAGSSGEPADRQAKSVSKPRHTAPSRFDSVPDE